MSIRPLFGFLPFSRGALLATISFAATAHAAGQGLVTDAVTGKPISDAAVFVYWGHEVGPTFHGSYWWKCDGTAFATTDAQGRYGLKLPFHIGLNPKEDRAPRMRVIAHGYYDDRIKPAYAGEDTDFGRVLRTLTWRKHKPNEYLWSPALMPFAQAGIDARLLTLHWAFPDRGFTDAVGAEFAGCQNSENYRQYALTVARVFDRVQCPTDGEEIQAPRADIVRFYPHGVWPQYAMQWPDPNGLWRKYVEALLPAKGEDRVPPIALHNVCAVTHPLVPGAVAAEHFGAPKMP